MVRKVTSLVMLWSFIALTYTGIGLYVAPHGRTSGWIAWSFLGLDKKGHAEIHTTFMVLFFVATFLPLDYKWRPFIGYLKNLSRRVVILTKEMLIATGISLLFVWGTLAGWHPFSDVVELGATLKEGWEKSYVQPPFNRAEALPLKQLATRAKLELSSALESLEASGYKASGEESLEEIGLRYKVAPAKLFEIIKKGEAKGQ